ncbi:MAG: hypothetical protein O2854_03665 [Chloroflexi bacterium]|nr:hypothetical protein [Chloroflexota bacterium]
MLEVIPNIGFVRNYIFMHDYTKIEDVFGIERPQQEPQSEAELEEYGLYVQVVSERLPKTYEDAPFIGGFGTFNAQSWPGLTAFEIWPHKTFAGAVAGESPNDIQITSGMFDPSSTNTLIAACDGCASEIRDLYAQENYQGTLIHTWGDGYYVRPSLRFEPPFLDGLGRAMPIAILDEYIFRSNHRNGVAVGILTNQSAYSSLFES